MEPRLGTPTLATYREDMPSVESGEQFARPNCIVRPADDAQSYISEATVEYITPVRWTGPKRPMGPHAVGCVRDVLARKSRKYARVFHSALGRSISDVVTDTAGDEHRHRVLRR